MQGSLYVLLSTASLCCALPALSAQPTDLSSPSSKTELSEGRKFEVDETETRQGAALLAALGAGLAPIIVSLARPLLSQLAGNIFGRLQELQSLSEAEPTNYDAYMINSPNSAGPYLFLTNPKVDNSAGNPKRPSDIHFPASSLSSTGTLSSSHPTFGIRKPATIKKHIGRISIKSQLPDDGESRDQETLSELRIINSPSYDIYTDEIVARR